MAKQIKIRIDADETELILDLPNFKLIPPETGIYDEPVRWYKANLQWAKIIEGFVGHLLVYHAWKEAENENYVGVQEIATWLEGVEVPQPAFPTEGDCFEYPLFAPFIDYEPQDPFNEPDYIPPPYLMPTFILNDELEYPEILGYQATDVFVPFGAVNIDPIDLATMNLPRLILSVKGSGQIELDLLAVAFGGIAVIKVGEMPNIADIVLDNIYDTGIQVWDLEVPAGTVAHAGNVIRASEINVEAAPDETTLVYIVFSPKVNDSIIPIAFGGGIRAIQLCGFEGGGEIVGLEDIRFNGETCAFEKRIGGEWLVIEGNDLIAECFGGGGMATKDDIRDGMYEAMNRLAAQIVSGRYTDIQIDDEGNVSQPSEDGGEAGLPEDDPTTPIDETDASHYGGVFALGTKIEEVIDKADSLYGAVNGTPTTPESSAIVTMTLLYPCDHGVMGAAITGYYAYRATNPQLGFNGGTDFFQHLFCNGYDINSINRFLINVRLFATQKTLQINNILISLLPEFWTENFERGTQSPSTKYLDAACVKTPPQEILVMPLNTNRQFFGLKANHRILLTFKGYVTDSDGDLQDSFWYRTAAGVLTRSNPTFGYGAGVAQPSDNEVPYNTAHIYQFTMELPNASTTMTINLGENAGIGTPIYQPEQFEIDFEDLGLPYGS